MSSSRLQRKSFYFEDRKSPHAAAYIMNNKWSEFLKEKAAYHLDELNHT